MRTIKLTKFPAGWVFVFSSALFVISFVIEIYAGNSQLYTVPFFWILVTLCAPLLSSGCTIIMWFAKPRSRWLVALATFLALLQLVCWFSFVAPAFSYGH
jgi:hypothetical protein